MKLVNEADGGMLIDDSNEKDLSGNDKKMMRDRNCFVALL